ncbi:recombinase family protein [Clostridiaceae bacterium 35-E11]
MRCAVYVRVSTDMETQKTSIAHQISYFEKYIVEKGWYLYETYQDIESGRSVKKRNGLQKLLEDSEQNKFDTILTKSISRFARNTLEGLTLIRNLKAKNIRFITIEDGFDSAEYDEFMFTLLLSIAQKESEKMSERIKFGKLCRAKKGYYNGSLPPYGYKKIDDHKIVPAEDETTDVVKKIFAMYLEGKGLYKIAKELNERGEPTPSQTAGKRKSSLLWHQSTIQKILCNRFYVGDMVQNKTATKDVLTGERKKNEKEQIIWVKNTHQGIIDPVVFEEVQRQCDERKKKKSGAQKSLFSNMLICGECGSRMHYKKNKQSYICGKLNKMGKSQCRGAYIKEETIKNILCNELKEIINDSISQHSFIQEIIIEIEKQDVDKVLQRIERQKVQLYQQKNRLIELLIQNYIDEQTYQQKREKIEIQKEKLVEEKKEMIQMRQKEKAYAENFVEKILDVEHFNKITLHKLIKRIRIFGKFKVEIEYTFKV